MLSATRANLKKVAKRLHLANDRVNTDQLMEICQIVKPSKMCKSSISLQSDSTTTAHPHTPLVNKGGILFEQYLQLQGSYTSHREYTQHVQAAALSGDDAFMSEATQEATFKREDGAFHGWVIKAVANIGDTGKKQMFFTTFVARYHGLSKSGADILAHYGYCMKRTLYKEMRKAAINNSRAHTAYTTRHTQ